MLGDLNDKQMDAVLQSQVIGRIGCHADGVTYVVPVTYAYDGKFIICHSREGKKIEMMRKNPQVCFEVERVENMTNWQSVLIQGKFEELKGDDAEIALQQLMNRVLPLMISETAHPVDPGSSNNRRQNRSFAAIIFRIRIKEKTGRFEKR
ncbi:MAG TPA: pyridoxamine 5'-phosphate oxidase family protein [Chitinophagaceae bacterium]|nr:pyridoxamine 5'-phosphate oxidase family protein [Chitinophagaceae bacterium]